jgi:hypothetical protein
VKADQWLRSKEKKERKKKRRARDDANITTSKGHLEKIGNDDPLRQERNKTASECHRQRAPHPHRADPSKSREMSSHRTIKYGQEGKKREKMYKTQRPPKSQYMAAFFTHIENTKKIYLF